jgi:hypothetical protein
MRSIFLIASLFISSQLLAQEKSSNTVPGQTMFYAELGGPGILFSANIDRRFTKSALGFGGRIGLGFVTTDVPTTTTPNPFGGGFYYNYETRSIPTIPIQLSYVFGKTNSVHSMEVGAGVTFTGRKIDIFDNNYSTNSVGSSAFGTASFMYRKIPKDGGFTWRIGFTPVIGGGYIQPSGGVGIGYSF